MLLCLEHGLWAPNLHFRSPNTSIPALREGRLQVVDRPLPVRGGIVAINSFGFGGSNVHIILRPNSRLPSPTPHITLPRLLRASGRTAEAVRCLLEQGHRHHRDLAFVSMLNDVAASSPTAMPFRGFTVLGVQDGSLEVHEAPTLPAGPRPVWFICSGESPGPPCGGEWAPGGCQR